MRGPQQLPSLHEVFPVLRKEAAISPRTLECTDTLDLQIDPAVEYAAHQSYASHQHPSYSTASRHSPPARAESLGMSMLSDRKKGIYARAQRL